MKYAKHLMTQQATDHPNTQQTMSSNASAEMKAVKNHLNLAAEAKMISSTNLENAQMAFDAAREASESYRASLIAALKHDKQACEASEDANAAYETVEKKWKVFQISGGDEEGYFGETTIESTGLLEIATVKKHLDLALKLKAQCKSNVRNMKSAFDRARRNLALAREAVQNATKNDEEACQVLDDIETTYEDVQRNCGVIELDSSDDEGEDDDQVMQIFLEMSRGQRMTIDAKPCDTISELKSKIEAEINPAPSEGNQRKRTRYYWRIYYDGVYLPSRSTLGDCNIQKDSILRVH